MEYRILGKTNLRVSVIALGREGFMHKSASEVEDFDFAMAKSFRIMRQNAASPAELVKPAARSECGLSNRCVV